MPSVPPTLREFQRSSGTPMTLPEPRVSPLASTYFASFCLCPLTCYRSESSSVRGPPSAFQKYTRLVSTGFCKKQMPAIQIVGSRGRFGRVLCGRERGCRTANPRDHEESEQIEPLKRLKANEFGLAGSPPHLIPS